MKRVDFVVYSLLPKAICDGTPAAHSFSIHIFPCSVLAQISSTASHHSPCQLQPGRRRAIAIKPNDWCQGPGSTSPTVSHLLYIYVDGGTDGRRDGRTAVGLLLDVPPTGDRPTEKRNPVPAAERDDSRRTSVSFSSHKFQPKLDRAQTTS